LATQVMCNNVSKELRNILSLMDEMGLAAETGLKFREESQIRIKICGNFFQREKIFHLVSKFLSCIGILERFLPRSSGPCAIWSRIVLQLK